MVEPRIVPRAAHQLSRRDIDPDALKVLYRLRQFDHIAYLVGGSVRDLLLNRRPKDFDIGTSAHPYQVKKLFRNCWIIGRRFRLAHVKFGSKVIEVATFRRQVEPGEEIVEDGVPAPAHHDQIARGDGVSAELDRPPAGSARPERAVGAAPGVNKELLVHHDNTFGTPEEDAFRRDFTINALFYDIATFAIIDYVGGLDDLHQRVVRSIGDPDIRVREDPVRMLRAVALAARLDFTIDPPVVDAIRKHRREIAESSTSRLLEECYKILRAGAAEKTFRRLAEVGLLEPISAGLHRGAGDALWRSLAELDAYRGRFESTPNTLTNPILVGSLLVPLGVSLLQGRRESPADGGERHASGPKLGDLPFARRDLERLRQILGLQRRLRDLAASQRAKRALAHRPIFRDALTWLEVHAGTPYVVDHWKAIVAEGPLPELTAGGHEGGTETGSFRRRRRRRRRRFRPAP